MTYSTGKTMPVVKNEIAPMAYDVKQVALLLNLSQQMVWKLIYSNNLKSVRFGRAVRILSTDLDAYISSAVTKGMGN
ncbi:DNA binding domain, excisionase family [Gleimia coleocanis DSM 15436]|uniref:DNA binding domain, excisionase family n=1 Tax=Gleimia coleocanis DSM 15436 TaxID=525245 RepID=C0W0M6_9ACTO|nr:helix-turn-helix domain-containing protein [Gleimia coleocanis]EEH64085.1 DNA binding domain, excisionase family [Gleimia coleocanis DSM 15436]